MAADKQATFGIRVNAESNAELAAASVDSLRARIAASQDAVKNYNSSMRMLRGSSDEVTAAKAKLKGAVTAEREAISRAALALGRQGVTYEEVAKKAKAAAVAQNNVKNALSTAGGPVAALNGKLETLKGIFGGSAGAMGGFALAGAGVVAAIAAISAAAVAGAVSLGRFVLEQSNALRTMAVFREAATGSAVSAEHFGNQIDDLAKRIPTSREELNKLSISLSKSLIGARISGQGIVDTFEAVASASAAMGDSAGSALEGIITRGKMFGRMGIGINELQGTGLKFNDVASELAKQLHVGLGEAQNQLVMGRVQIDAGAAAIKAAVEKRFGAVNAKGMLDINVQIKKFHDNLQKLTEGFTKNGGLDRVLESFAKLGKLFDTSTVTGAALRDLITDFGEVMGRVFEAGTPIAVKFFKQIVIESLHLESALLSVGIFMRDTFGVNITKAFGDGSLAIDIAKVAFWGITAAVTAFGVAAAAAIAPFYAIYKIAKDVKDVFDAITGLGEKTSDGFARGLQSAEVKVKSAAKSMANAAKDGVRQPLLIQSPSKVFETYGRQTGQGFERGIAAATPGVQRSVNGMAPDAPRAVAMSRGGLGGGGNANVNVTLAFPSVKNGAETTAALNSASFKAQFTKLLEEALRGAGAPTQGGA